MLGNTNPVFEQECRMSSVGKGALLVLNVMSKHSFGGDTIIGQVGNYYLIPLLLFV